MKSTGRLTKGIAFTAFLLNRNRSEETIVTLVIAIIVTLVIATMQKEYPESVFENLAKEIISDIGLDSFEEIYFVTDHSIRQYY